jgi:serine/threonine protein kinase
MAESNSLPAESPFELEHHEIIRPLASGGMAQLYLAWQVRPGGVRRRVVLKRIHRHLVADPEFVEMFLNEARIGAGLTHPNIVHLYDVLTTKDGDPVLVMEYINGVSVHGLLRAARRQEMGFPLNFAVHVVMAIAEALEYAYETVGPDGEKLRIVHRDVSPSNILVSVEGRVKLVDFGIAKASASAALTKAGQVKGKYQYMSPEQLRGEELDARSDLFALGAILYELTTGSRVFRGKTDVELITALLTAEIDPPSSRKEGYPEELERIVMSCLSRSRDARPPSARALYEQLESCATACDFTMRSVTLGTFVSTLFPERLEADPAPSGPRPVLKTEPLIVPTMPLPMAIVQPSPSGAPPESASGPDVDVPIDIDVAPAKRDATVLVVGIGLVVASILFWLVVYPLLAH